MFEREFNKYFPLFSFFFSLPFNLFILYWSIADYRTSLVTQMVKCLSTMQETWVWSLGGEDSLEKEMATHSSTLA